jgi:hypothetical protein
MPNSRPQVFLPPLPEGFVLEGQLPEGHVILPPLPEGFVLDPTFKPAASAIELPPGFTLDPTFKPAVSTGEDVARSAASGLANGAAGVAGSLGDARGLFDRFGDWIGEKMGYTPEQIAKSHGVHAMSDKLLPQLPTTEQVKKGTGLDAADYDPQTTAGRYAKSVGEFLPGAATGGAGSARAALVNAARFGVAPGVASEAAGEALKGSPYEPIARIAAGLAAPGVAGRAISPFPFRGPEASAEAYARAVQTLRDEGVHVSAGRASDNARLKYLENDLNPEAAKEELEGYTRAATRAAGTETPVVIHGQGGTVDTLRREVGSRFDRLQANNTLHADVPLVQELYDLRNEYTRVPGAYPEATVRALNGAIDHSADLLRNGGLRMTGEQYQRARHSTRPLAQPRARTRRRCTMWSRPSTTRWPEASPRTIRLTPASGSAPAVITSGRLCLNGRRPRPAKARRVATSRRRSLSARPRLSTALGHTRRGGHRSHASGTRARRCSRRSRTAARANECGLIRLSARSRARRPAASASILAEQRTLPTARSAASSSASGSGISPTLRCGARCAPRSSIRSQRATSAIKSRLASQAPVDRCPAF